MPKADATYFGVSLACATSDHMTRSARPWEAGLPRVLQNGAA